MILADFLVTTLEKKLRVVRDCGCGIISCFYLIATARSCYQSVRHPVLGHNYQIYMNKMDCDDAHCSVKCNKQYLIHCTKHTSATLAALT